MVFKALHDLPSLPPVTSLTSSSNILPSSHSTPATLASLIDLKHVSCASFVILFLFIYLFIWIWDFFFLRGVTWIAHFPKVRYHLLNEPYSYHPLEMVPVCTLSILDSLYTLLHFFSYHL